MVQLSQLKNKCWCIISTLLLLRNPLFSFPPIVVFHPGSHPGGCISLGSTYFHTWQVSLVFEELDGLGEDWLSTYSESCLRVEPAWWFSRDGFGEEARSGEPPLQLFLRDVVLSAWPPRPCRPYSPGWGRVGQSFLLSSRSFLSHFLGVFFPRSQNAQPEVKEWAILDYDPSQVYIIVHELLGILLQRFLCSHLFTVQSFVYDGCTNGYLCHSLSYIPKPLSFLFFLKLVQLWSLEALPIGPCISLTWFNFFFFSCLEYFITFCHHQTLQAHLACLRLLPCDWPFLQGS